MNLLLIPCLLISPIALGEDFDKYDVMSLELGRYDVLRNGDPLDEKLISDENVYAKLLGFGGRFLVSQRMAAAVTGMVLREKALEDTKKYGLGDSVFTISGAYKDCLSKTAAFNDLILGLKHDEYKLGKDVSARYAVALEKFSLVKPNPKKDADVQALRTFFRKPSFEKSANELPFYKNACKAIEEACVSSLPLAVVVYARGEGKDRQMAALFLKVHGYDVPIPK